MFTGIVEELGTVRHVERDRVGLAPRDRVRSRPRSTLGR